MSNRIHKKEVVRRLAQRLDADEKTAEVCLDAVLETLYEAIKDGEEGDSFHVYSPMCRR